MYPKSTRIIKPKNTTKLSSTFSYHLNHCPHNPRDAQ